MPARPDLAMIVLEWLLLFVLGFGTAAGVAYVLRRRGLRRIARLQRENAELLGEESRIFTFLHDLGTTLGDDRGLRRLHEEIVEGVAQVADAGGAVLYLVDAKAGTHFVPAGMTPHCPPLVEVPADLRPQRAAQARLRWQSRLTLNGCPGRDGAARHCT